MNWKASIAAWNAALLLDQVVVARTGPTQKLDQLDGQQREAVEQEQLIARLQSELDKAVHEAGATEAADRPEIILEHLPTPMARTVFRRRSICCFAAARSPSYPGIAWSSCSSNRFR